MTDLEQPLALPVSTTFEIANRTISEHIGPTFGIIAWPAGTVAGVKSFGLMEILALGTAVKLAP